VLWEKRERSEGSMVFILRRACLVNEMEGKGEVVSLRRVAPLLSRKARGDEGAGGKGKEKRTDFLRRFPVVKLKAYRLTERGGRGRKRLTIN